MRLASSDRQYGPWLGRSGTTSLEFALVAIPFIFLLVAGTDLGRYFITRHSLHTLISEAARATLIKCFGVTTTQTNPPRTQCALSSTDWPTVEAKVPFLDSSLLSPSPTATQNLNTAT